MARPLFAWLIFAITLCRYVQCQLMVIGTFNGKTWFNAPETARGHQEACRYTCERHGYNLAEFHSVEEMEWVLNNTPPTVRLMWTAGVNHDTRSGFLWGLGTSGGSPIAPQVPFHGSEQFHDAVGLAISRDRRSLVSKKRDEELNILCST